MVDTGRRELLLAAGAAMAAAAIPGASAQTGSGTSGLSYRNVRNLVAALGAREVSAVELTNAAIARVEALDGKLNAVVVRDFDNARAAAAQADAALGHGERRPPPRIPMTLKEAFNVARLPTTWGLPAGKGRPVAEDAVAVARLKAAGAIILGKTNVPFMLAD